MNAAPSPVPRTRPCGCGTWRRGAACACLKATQTGSGAWRGAPMNVTPSPAPGTRPCGCGTWRRVAACACSKATRPRLERGVERRWTPRLLRRREGRHPGVESIGICRRSASTEDHGANLAASAEASPIHQRQSPPRRRERRGQDGAFQLPRPRHQGRGRQTAAFHRRRLGDPLATASSHEERQGGPRNLSLGFRRAGGLPPRPSALHGRHGGGGARLQPPERKSFRRAGPLGPRPPEGGAEAVRQAARRRAHGSRWTRGQRCQHEEVHGRTWLPRTAAPDQREDRGGVR